MNWKQKPNKFERKFTFAMVLWILIDVVNFSLIFFKFRQYENVKIANFVYYGKTRIAVFG